MCSRTRAVPQCRVLRSPLTVFHQPKIASIRFRTRWLRVYPACRVMRPSTREPRCRLLRHVRCHTALAGKPPADGGVIPARKMDTRNVLTTRHPCACRADRAETYRGRPPAVAEIGEGGAGFPEPPTDQPGVRDEAVLDAALVEPGVVIPVKPPAITETPRQSRAPEIGRLADVSRPRRRRVQVARPTPCRDSKR